MASKDFARLAQERLEQIRAAKVANDPGRAQQIADAKSDFPTFCQLVRIVPKTGRKVPLHLNAIQELFHVERTGRDIVLKPRQVGLTTLELARDLWLLLSREGARVVVVCQSTTDHAPAKSISGVLRVMLEALREAGWAIRFTTEAWNEFVLPNGNSLRIVEAGASEDAAEKKGRSGTITRLHLTETAFYEYADQTLNALMECVPGPESGSEIVIESTANGASGLFYRFYKSAQALKNGYKAHFFPWFSHPEYRIRPENDNETAEFEARDDLEAALLQRGVSAEQLLWRRRKIEEKGADNFDQEYPADPESCFIVSGATYFDKKATAELFKEAKGAEPLEVRSQGRIRIWKRPDHTRRARYVLALDPSQGEGGDPAGGILLDRDTAELCAVIDGQFSPAQLAEEAAKLGFEYNEALIAPERNNHGHAVLLALTKVNERTGRVLYANIYRHTDDKLGWDTNQVTRPSMLSDLEDAVRHGLVKCRDHAVLTQVRTFVLKNGRPEAASGAHDDLVMAYAVGWYVRQNTATPIRPTKQLPHASRWGGTRGYG